MLKVFLFVAAIFTTLQLQAEGTLTQDQINDEVARGYCSWRSENLARGKVSGIYSRSSDRKHVHSTRSTFMKNTRFKNQYFVTVEVTYRNDFILLDTMVYYSCYRCPNGKLEVTNESYETACAREQ